MDIRHLLEMLANVAYIGAFIFLIICFAVPVAKGQAVSVVIFIIVVIAYYYLSFTSDLFALMSNIMDASKVYDVMSKYFKSEPTIKMKVDCYHMEGDGDKIISRTETKEIHYRSWRDASGPFTLDLKKASKDETYAYVALDIVLSIEGAPDGSVEDVEKQREEFKRNNKHDDKQEYNEENIVEGLKTKGLIKVTDYDPCGVGMLFYVIFSILPFNYLYQLYVSNYYTKQHFGLRKLISTRADLRSEEMKVLYRNLDPIVTYKGNDTRFFFAGTMPVAGSPAVPHPTQSFMIDQSGYEMSPQRNPTYQPSMIGYQANPSPNAIDPANAEFISLKSNFC